jgi:hypothetical protein
MTAAPAHIDLIRRDVGLAAAPGGDPYVAPFAAAETIEAVLVLAGDFPGSPVAFTFRIDDAGRIQDVRIRS